jgi:putative ABC transport system permease protein
MWLLLSSPALIRKLGLGVPLLRGRFFGEQDAATSPRTAIINATMSRRFWPGEDPLAKRFKFAYQTAADPWITVVGVVGDMHRDGVTRDPVSEIFLPLSQHPARGMDLVVAEIAWILLLQQTHCSANGDAGG